MRKCLLVIVLAGAFLPQELRGQGYTGNLNRGSGAGLSMGRLNDATLLSASETLERRAEYLLKTHRKAVKQNPGTVTPKDELETEISNLSQSASELYGSWSFQRNLERGRKDFVQVVKAGFTIHRILPSHPLRSMLQGEWDAVREEIDELIAILKMPKVNWDLIAGQPQPQKKVEG